MKNAGYDSVGECLTVIPKIVWFFRKQYFYEGNKRLVSLIEKLNWITELYLQRKDLETDRLEWLQLLETFMLAQENKDYILLADIMERDLLNALQKLELQLQTEEKVRVSDYWEENLVCIEKEDSYLFGKLKDSDLQSENIYEPLMALNGQISCKVTAEKYKFCICSTINPQWEGHRLAESIYEEDSREYWVYGMGMGYHVQEILELDMRNKVVVLENEIDLLRLSLTYLNWQPYLNAGRLRILYETDAAKLIGKLRDKNENSIFFVHYPSLQCIQKLEVKEALEDFFISASSMREQKHLLDTNFQLIQNADLPECECLKEMFCGKKVVLVGGGPSVEDELETIKAKREEVMLVVVGTVARKFLQNGIRPDAIVITDPQDCMYRQIENLETEQIPLILLSTASAKILSYYKGNIYVAYQEGYPLAERVAEKRGYMLFQTGGSVSTLALDMLIRFETEKIILVGMDMAYTDNRSHVKGVGREICDVEGLRTVVSNEGKQCFTSRNLDIYRKWIEHRIEGLRYPMVYNTGRGAKIKGTIYLEHLRNLQ